MNRAGPIMTTPHSLRSAQRIDVLCDQFEEDWSVGRAESIEAVLARVPHDERRPLLRELLQIELEQRVAAGELLTVQAWLDRFPDDQDLVYHGFQVTEPHPDPRPEPSNLRGRLLNHIVRFITHAGEPGARDPLKPAPPFDDIPFRD
jgi:hypothetical protein